MGAVRVLHIGKYYPPHPGGIERVLEELCLGLSDRVDLEVLCFHDQPHSVTDRVDGVLVHRMARWDTWFSVPIAPGMFWWLRERAYDLVHLHVPNPLAELLYLASGVSGELVVSHHADPQKFSGLMRLYGPVARRIRNRARAIVVATPHHLSPGTELHPWRDKARVIPYGIDVDRFGDAAAEAAAARWRERYGEVFLLFVGRLVPYKGLKVLLEAMRGIDVPLLIAGTGPFFANLQQLRGGLEDKVHLLGKVDDSELPGLYRAARALVLPSLDRSEAFGMVQIEAFAAGTPVVASRLDTGVSWVNRDRETGILVPPGDPAALRSALSELVEDAGLADRLGAAGNLRAREFFSRQRQAEDTMTLYQELLRR